MIFLFSNCSFEEFLWLISPVFEVEVAQFDVSRRCFRSITFDVHELGLIRLDRSSAGEEETKSSVGFT